MRTWRVADVMTTEVVTVSPDVSYQEIVAKLVAQGVNALPVVDDGGRVAGVVSEADLVYKIEYTGGALERRIFASRRRRDAHAKAHGLRAHELMTAPAITVAQLASLTAAAKRMDDEQVSQLPVVDERGRLCGIVSRCDLLRVYLRPDSHIERDVRREVLRRTLWVDPEAVSVLVRRGVVTLAGRTDRRSTALLAVKLTAGVPGVVQVIDQLGFEFDDRALVEARPYGPSGYGMP